MGLIHHRAASHRKRIGRGNGPFPAGGTGGDTGLQVGAGGIKYGLALHIAYYAAVHLHRQHVLVIHHGAHGVHKDSQRHQRHHIGHRTAHQRKIHPGTAPQVGKASLAARALPNCCACSFTWARMLRMPWANRRKGAVNSSAMPLAAPAMYPADDAGPHGPARGEDRQQFHGSTGPRTGRYIHPSNPADTKPSPPHVRRGWRRRAPAQPEA